MRTVDSIAQLTAAERLTGCVSYSLTRSIGSVLTLLGRLEILLCAVGCVSGNIVK
jgi:hypothetical protein